MTDLVEFKVALIRANKKRSDVAAVLGISLMGLHKKLTNITEFKASEIETLRQFLCLSDDARDRIFFAH